MTETNLLDSIERSRLRSAAGRAKLIYPGPVGEMLLRELNSWESVGVRYGGGSLIKRLVNELLTTCLPVDTGAGLMCEAVYEGSQTEPCACCRRRLSAPLV